jgi:hypothetical protein
MKLITMDTQKTRSATPGDKLIEVSRLEAAVAEELLLATANHAGKRATDALPIIQDDLQDAKITGQNIHDNVWNWH